jgi:cobalt/nickel transport system permease protein
VSRAHRSSATATLSLEVVAAGDSPVHRLDPRVKIVGLVAVAVAVVTTPTGAWAAFAAYAVLLLGLAATARLRAGYMLRRMTVEAPFLVAAALLPFTTGGVAAGITSAATLTVKLTLGVLAMVVLSSTTPFPRLVRGLELLHIPRVLTLIVSFMWRYLYVLGEELRRMRIAREARGYHARWLWQAGAIGATIGALFVRALERGERVYLAMLARGYVGRMPAGVGEQLELSARDLTVAAGLGLSLAGIRGVLA